MCGRTIRFISVGMRTQSGLSEHHLYVEMLRTRTAGRIPMNYLTLQLVLES